MAQNYNPGRTRQSPVTPPPIDAPLFQDGQITLVWQAWLYQQFTTGKLVQDLAIQAAFQPEAGSDPTDAIEEAARILQGGDSGQFGAAVADLETASALGVGIDGRYAADIDELITAAAAADVPDGSLRAEVEALKVLVWYMKENRRESSIVSLVGTHAARLSSFPASAYENGSTYYETDRFTTYIVVDHVWTYQHGIMPGTLSPDLKPSDLGTSDAGFLFDSYDFKHLYLWNGLGWVFAPGDPGSGWGMWKFGVPLSGFWGLADSSTYDYALDDGTVGTLTTVDLNGGQFLRGGDSSENAATAPTWDASAKTEPETSLFGFPSVTDDEAAHVHTVSSGSSTGSSGAGPGTFSYVDSVGSPTSSGTPHNHGITNTNAPQLPHDHKLTDTNAKLNPPSDGAGGLPLNRGVSWYVRL